MSAVPGPLTEKVVLRADRRQLRKWAAALLALPVSPLIPTNRDLSARTSVNRISNESIGRL
jgi:hypothetical protein